MNITMDSIPREWSSTMVIGGCEIDKCTKDSHTVIRCLDDIYQLCYQHLKEYMEGQREDENVSAEAP